MNRLGIVISTFGKLPLALVFLLPILLCQTLPAVSFSLTPATVSNTYNGNITLQITGLTNGESVIVQKFLDANTNGVIDGADLLWQQFQLTDGQASVIGGVTNINVPGDTDTTPGQITARMTFRTSEPVLNPIGKYAWKLSSPTGLFAPLTNSFSIADTAYAQSLTGNVVNHGTNVPNAVVILFLREPGDDGPGSTFAGTVANNSGTYAIKLPAGAYGAVAIKSNYLGYLRPPLVVVGSGATVNASLTLTNATRTLSGRLVNAANPAVGLPGLFLHADFGELVSVVTSDTNGNFTLPVGPGYWEVGAIGLETLGYVNVDSDSQAAINTTTGNVSDVTISYPKANALFYGNVKDEQGQPLSGIEVEAENDDYSQWYYAFPDENGNYAVGALGGQTWEVEAEDEDLIPPLYLFPEGSSTNISAGQAIPLNFTGLRATNRITGQLEGNDGSPIPDIEIYAYAGIGGNFFYVETFTDVSGNYSLNVANGNWTVGVCLGCDDENSGYCRPNDQYVNITNANVVANFTSPGKTAIITSSPLPEGRVDEDYSIQFAAVTCGAGANWLATNPPSGLELSPAGELSGYPDTPGSNYFFVQMSDNTGGSVTKGFSLVIHPSTNGGVFNYYVNKLKSYRQTDPDSVVLDSLQGPYHAYLGMSQDSLGLVTNATCTLPTSVVKVFPPGVTDLELQVHEIFASESAFEAAYPAGNYSFAIHTLNHGSQYPVLSMPAPAYPNAPHLNNYVAAQAINPGSDFPLEWNSFSGGTSDDFIRFMIISASEVPAFKLSWYPEPVFENWFGSDTTATDIPAGILDAGRSYLGLLQFVKVADVNDVDYTNAYGQTFVSAQTAFSLATVSAAPVLSQPARLSATQFQFLVTGLAGWNYTIQKSTDLASTNWSVLYVTNAPVGSFAVVDQSATNGSAYYRAVFVPLSPDAIPALRHGD